MRSPVWQAGPGGLDEREQRVAVAVVADRLDRLRVARRRALVPQLVARAAPQVQLAGAARRGERLGVHVREREHLAGAPVLDHAGHEALLVVGDRRVVHRTADRSIRAMRAAIVRAHGGVPELDEFDDPEPADGAEVLEVAAAAMNPVDVRIASGEFALERHEPPYVAGKEGIGRRADGSLVYFDRTREPHGAFAERTLVDAGRRLPGAGRPRPGARRLPRRVGPGRVDGARVARAARVRRDACSCSARAASSARSPCRRRSCSAPAAWSRRRATSEALKRARSLGADAIVRLGQARTSPRALREAAGGDGYHVVLDPLWGEPAKAAIATLVPVRPARPRRPVGRRRGHAQLAGGPLEADRPARLHELQRRRGAARRPRTSAWRGHARDGELRVEIERLRLDDVPDAWQRQGSSPHRKLVIVP